MATVHFKSEDDVRAVERALRVAAEVYAKDAAECEAAGQERVARQFTRQAEQALRLAEDIEENE